MLIYNSIIFVMIISLFSIEKKYFGNLYYFIVFMLFIYFPIIIGVNSARPDYDGYVAYFYRLPKIFSPDYFVNFNETRLELGYALFTGIIKFFTNSATIFFIILCFLSFCFRFYFVKYFVHKEDIILVLFAFLAHEFLRKDCIQIRNGIASAMILFSLVFLFRKQKKIFCLMVLIASSFHSVAIIALPLIIFNAHISKKWMRIMQCIFLIVVISTFFFKIKEVLYIFNRLGIIPKRAANYLYWTQYSKPMPIYHPVVLKQIMICFFFLFIKEKILFYSNEKAIFLFKVYFVSTLYYLIFLDFELLAGRFGSLFSGVETLFLLQIIQSNTIKQKKLMKLSVFFLVCISFIMNLLTFTDTLSFKATFQ